MATTKGEMTRKNSHGYVKKINRFSQIGTHPLRKGKERGVCVYIW
jgi:hypothetical protein